MAGIGGYGDTDLSLVPVVFDGIVTEVIDHLIQDLGVALNHGALQLEVKGDAPLFRGAVQAVHNRLCYLGKVDLGLLQACGALIQLGEPDDIPHQHNKALGLVVNIACKVRNVLTFYHAVLHQLREAGNGGEGGFQLVGRHWR